MSRLFPFAGVVMALCALSACQLDASSLTPAQLNNVAQRTVKTSAIPGIAIAVISSDKVVIASAGVRHVGEAAALQTSDRMHLGSNIKAMTATLTASLVESGALRWNSTIVEILPELRASMRPEYLNVTIEDLLAHRGGLLPFVEPASFAQLPPLPADAVAARAALTAWLVQQPSPVTPRVDSLYSNAGYAVVAAMLERRTGQRFEDLLTVMVLQPLGIVPKFDWPATGERNQPWGHEWLNGRWVPNDPDAAQNQIPGFITPAGNLSISIGDYARFVQSQLQGLRGRAQIITSVEYQHLRTPLGRYALGWFVGDIKGVRTSARDGSAGTFYALATIQSQRDRAVIVLINAYSESTAATANALALTLLDQGK